MINLSHAFGRLCIIQFKSQHLFNEYLISQNCIVQINKYQPISQMPHRKKNNICISTITTCSSEKIRFHKYERISLHSKISRSQSESLDNQHHTFNGQDPEKLVLESQRYSDLTGKQICLPSIKNRVNKIDQMAKKTVKNAKLIPLSKRFATKCQIFKPVLHNMLDYSFLTHQGTRMYNQDRISIKSFTVNDQLFNYFAIFDGHGGHSTSQFLANRLHLLVKEYLIDNLDPSQALKAAINKIEQQIKTNFRMGNRSGSCAIVVLVTKYQCWIANVGDSRLISIDNQQNYLQITKDHKPETQSERKRIENNGGRVYRNKPEEQLKDLPFRAYPGGLSVSRTIGDAQIKKLGEDIIICQPDIFSLDLSHLSYLLMFSDGVYEKVSNRQISNYFLSRKQEAAISELFDHASKLKSQDNRSMIAIHIK